MASISPLPADLTSRIPQEIYDDVLAYVGESKVALKQCSLVCRAWLSTCRLFLFSRVSLSTSFAQFLRDPGRPMNMGVGRYIRHAILCGSWDILEGERLRRLLELLPRLAKLEALSFDSCQIDVIDSFVELQSKSFIYLSEVHLSQIRFPSFTNFRKTLSSFSGVKVLSLDGISWGELGDRAEVGAGFEAPDNTGSLSGLESVKIHYCRGTGRILNWLSSVTNGPLPLRSLTVPDLNPSEADSFRQFIKTHGPSLSDLTVGFFPHFTSNFLDNPTLLASCTRLKKLHVNQIILYQFPTSIPQPTYSLGESANQARVVPWYTKLLLSVSSTLTHLSFTLWFSAEPQLDRMDWRSLNTLLRSSPSLASLAEIHFVIWGYGPSRDTAIGWIRDRLPGLRPTTFLSAELAR